jgi:hypothetical protein
VIWQSDRLSDDGLDHGMDLYVSIPTTDTEDSRPPSLITLPTVTPRYQMPGEDVVIRARPQDDLSGVDRVWVQFKDPDDQWQDAAGIEHKLYGYLRSQVVSGIAIYVYEEMGCEAIDPDDYTYDWPFVLDYWMFGFDPTQPPPHSLELYDDGPVETGGHEAEGEVAEDKIYTRAWTTPDVPSDFYVDIILRDKVGNWMVYDSVYGFTTQQFVPTQSILYVQDYGHGQWFPSPHDAGIRYQYVPTESWLTWNPTMFIDPFNPQIGDAMWYQPAPPYAAQGPAASQSPLGYDGLSRDGEMVGGQPYDIWRVQCRGVVDRVALGAYLPYLIQEPSPGDATTTRTRKACERCVFWSSPYSGDLWVADGTILDPFVQENIQWFVTNGGRIFMSGQNIGWALTLDGTVTNSMLATTFGADYQFDFNGGWADYHLTASTLETTLRPVQHPIWDTMYPPATQQAMEHYVIEWPFWPFIMSAVTEPAPTIDLGGYAVAPGFLIAVENNAATRLDACPNQGFVDNFVSAGKGQLEYTYTASGYSAMLLTHDTASHAKTAFAAWGLEGLFNGVHNYTPPGGANYAVNDRRRMQVLHDAACWMRQGRLSGVLTYFDQETKEFKPLANALVSVWSGGLPLGTPEGTALSNSEGAFLVAGLDSYLHGVTAYRPGYLMQHGILVGAVEGPLETTGFDIILTKTQPGWISGVVKDQNGEPVIGVTITATETIFGVLSYSAVTDNTGAYRIDAVETGNYIVRVTGYPTGYGSSVPPSYGDEDDPESARPIPLVVQPNTGVTGIDFVLEGSPGTITGMVTSEDTGQVIANALIEALAGGTVRHTATSGQNGRYTISDVPAGMYSVRCTAPGYVVKTMSSIQVVSGETVTVDFDLTSMPPGSLSGQVRYYTDNSLAGAGVAAISIYLGTTLVAGPVATTDPVTSPDGYVYNYKFDEVPAGTYTIVIESAEYNSDPPSQQGIKVTSGQERKNVNFKLVPLHIFANGLRLVSSLYDYDALLHAGGGLDAADLLGMTYVDNGITHKPLDMAMWYAGSYLYFPKALSDPRPPNPSELARTFRLGRGYFLRLTSNAALTRKGVEAPSTSSYPIECEPGWNLIGAVFEDNVSWNQVQVQVGSNAPMTMYAAISAGYITNQIWTYLGLGNQYENSTVLRPWEGYWVKTDRSLKLLVPPPLGRGREPEEGGRGRALVSASGEDGWLLPIVASTSSTRDASNYIGASSTANDGFDNLNDLEEPPAVEGVPYLSLYFPHDAWGARSGRYAMDVRSTGAATTEWEVDVETNLAGAEVSLSWPGISRAPRDVNLTLVDTKTGTRSFMRTSSSYRFRLEKGEDKRRFRIEMVRDDAGLLRVTEVLAKPARAAKGTTISFGMTREANVEVRITSLNGRAIRRIAGGETRARGVNQVVWDGRDDAGRTVPAGAYVVEVRAASADGQKVRAVALLNVVR